MLIDLTPNLEMSCILNEKCQKYQDSIQNILPEAVQLSKELMLDQRHSNLYLSDLEETVLL